MRRTGRARQQRSGGTQPHAATHQACDRDPQPDSREASWLPRWRPTPLPPTDFPETLIGGMSCLRRPGCLQPEDAAAGEVGEPRLHEGARPTSGHQYGVLVHLLIGGGDVGRCRDRSTKVPDGGWSGLRLPAGTDRLGHHPSGPRLGAHVSRVRWRDRRRCSPVQELRIGARSVVPRGGWCAVADTRRSCPPSAGCGCTRTTTQERRTSQRG